MFRRLVRLFSFPVCKRQVDATPIPKGPPSSSVAKYPPISMSSVLSKVFEHLLMVRLGDLWNAVVCFQLPRLLIEKVWVPMMFFFCVPYTSKCIGEWAGGLDHRD